MTNGQNIVRARHVDSLAADLSDFVTQSNDELHQAVQAELADLTPAETSDDTQVVLSSDSSIVDGTLWLEDVTNAAPVVKLYHGGNVYDFPTTPDFTVIDHSTATAGVTITIIGSDTSVVGSAYNDLFTSRTGTGCSNCTIYCSTGNDKVSLRGNSNSNCIILHDGSNSVRGWIENCTVYGGTGDDLIYCSGDSNYVDLNVGGNNKIQIAASNNTVICGAGNDSINFTDSLASLNHVYLNAGNNTVDGAGNPNTTIYSGSGNDLFWGLNKSAKLLTCKIHSFGDGDTLKFHSGTWSASLDSSTVLITVNGSSSSVITCQDYTATQFHISAGGTDGVYTIQGSSLVLAGS